mmetsp:Transcript_25424/g.60588  ORF Transcript_25424/g.60588 Transcript_25424/m.60588 type:complete len:214 (+) Transcript_25424:691-1332(+)
MWKLIGSLWRSALEGDPARMKRRSDFGEDTGGAGSTGTDSLGARTTAPMMRRFVLPVNFEIEGERVIFAGAASVTAAAASSAGGCGTAGCTLKVGSIQVPTEGQNWNGLSTCASDALRVSMISAMALSNFPPSAVFMSASRAFSRTASTGSFCTLCRAVVRRPSRAADINRSRASNRRDSSRAVSRAVDRRPSMAARTKVARASRRAASKALA